MGTLAATATVCFPAVTCEAEAQQAQGCTHTHIPAGAAGSTQHLPVRQLTAGLSTVEGWPGLQGRGSEVFVAKGPPQGLSHHSCPEPAAPGEVLLPIPQGSQQWGGGLALTLKM